jgi:parallel beta-helix repeat protein
MRPVARLALGAALLGACGVVSALFVVERMGVAPRALAPYVEKRSSGHNPAIVGAGQYASRMLLALDRGEVRPVLQAELHALAIGAQQVAVGGSGGEAAQRVDVIDVDGLRAAMKEAAPGTIITLAPGTYSIGGRALEANRGGSAEAPIVVRAAQPGSVTLVSSVLMAVKVSAPYWRFENLTIDGACQRDDDCEHAFQVVGAASYFAAVNNTIGGFNAHFKINGSDGRFPDHGLIEANTLFNPAPRATRQPVTPIDLVAASHWTIRSNIVRDFVKMHGNQISYGAFAKGGGSGNVFERNLIWCERELTGQPGQRIGVSLGGGGTGKSSCRDGRCITEQDGSVLRANLIVGCSDAGIYLNSAAGSRIEDNTVLDTGGIDVRYPTSSAQLDGNLVDGPIRARDGALLRLGDNRDTGLWRSFVGHHPVRALFGAPTRGDFGWAGDAPLRADGPAPESREDLCGAARGATRIYGAFEDFTACRRP